MVNANLIRSLTINDPRASHRIVGSFTSGIEGHGTQHGIIGYYTRMDVGDALSEMFRVDPGADLRVEPHNADLMLADPAPLRSTDVEWIINDQGEIGVKILDQFFFVHKGASFMYASPEGENTPKKYRAIGKRELGESCKIDDERLVDGYLDRGVWLDIIFSTARQEVTFFNAGEGWDTE